MPTDHPRLRGEHDDGLHRPRLHGGSPPPARGALADVVTDQLVLGITPACAGSTSQRHRRPLSIRDHPRLRGEHPKSATCYLSRDWITPACAGSTRSNERPTACSWDHPRLRGEHCGCAVGSSDVPGSPPPARGAPTTAPTQEATLWITPACAGSTLEVCNALGDLLDHPRLRGEHVR